MASPLSEGSLPLEQEAESGLVQKCHDAYAAQPTLPKDLAKEGIVNPLGMGLPCTAVGYLAAPLAPRASGARVVRVGRVAGARDRWSRCMSRLRCAIETSLVR